ncbi:MAG: hypothetical protein KIT69_13035 [Propionibacteriaceae bacterium]|nr:hypothetical protein [Propionibacteriaceae bacterium]
MADLIDDARNSRVRPRRDLRLIAVGVLAVCLSGLGAVWLYSSATDAVSVVAVLRSVHRGQTITDADLGLVSVPSVPGLETVPAEQLGVVVGQSAHTDLVAGSLLSPRSFGPPVVNVGMAQLGLRLTPGRVPSTALPPGTPVLLVAVARDGGEPPDAPSVLATVASLGTEQPDGSTLLDVDVPAEHAERVARLAASDQLVVVRQEGVLR